jgi:hypothetical protein
MILIKNFLLSIILNAFVSSNFQGKMMKFNDHKRHNQIVQGLFYEIDTKFGKCMVGNCWNMLCAGPPKGNCVNINCECSKGYYTYPSNSMSKCCYEQKSQLITFLLEALIGFGVGHIYAMNYSIGIIKLVTYSVLFLFLFTTFCYRFFRTEKIGYENYIMLKFASILSMMMCFCTYTVWQCIDILLIGTNFYVDGNGAPLSKW